MEGEKKKSLIGVVAVAATLGASIGAMIFIKSKKSDADKLLMGKS